MHPFFSDKNYPVPKKVPKKVPQKSPEYPTLCVRFYSVYLRTVVRLMSTSNGKEPTGNTDLLLDVRAPFNFNSFKNEYQRIIVEWCKRGNHYHPDRFKGVRNVPDRRNAISKRTSP